MAVVGGEGADPKKVVVVSLTGASHSEHDTDIPGAEPQSVRAGHEPDKFQVRSILAVPALLATMVLLSFVAVTVIFFTQYTRFSPLGNSVNERALDLSSTPAAGGKGRVERDVSERVSRISSTKPQDLKGVPGTAVPQPRLEYLKKVEPETTDDPAWERSKRPVESPENTYEIRPEDLRPNNYVDPQTREKVLVTYGWVDPKHTIARMPIEAAIQMVLDKKVLKARKDAIPSPVSSIHTPTLSNGGQPVKPNATTGNAGPTPPPAATGGKH